MKYIRTPTGEVFKKEECIEFEDDLFKSEVVFDTENQEELAKELFKNTGILTGKWKGGENAG